MSNFEFAFREIKSLVERFQDGIHLFKKPEYSEAQARKDFIDKFFIALGWDVNHDRQHNPYEQEVKVERSQKQHDSIGQKRADYAFFAAPNFKDVKFFVEAKKPAGEMRNPDFYFQTIRYGWNANTPIAILTDFEELHIIDCRYKPNLATIFNGKHKSFHFTDYLNKEKFAEIYFLFSWESVINKSIEKYVENLPKVRGRKIDKINIGGQFQAIDESFLEYIDAIRENLAKAFKKSSIELDSEMLTEAVTRTIDRLVFIRFLEDKLIEPVNHVSEWRSWNDFILDCRRLETKYNGVVFKKHLIDEQDFSGADEKMFLGICKDISSQRSPYDFNYIPIHILGSIYERFLGKIVVATDKRVHIEEKPEVRKAGGVYYTPKYVVDYIVKNTVGKVISGKTPKQISSLHFADIACGSGSFLISVYDCLLDYHKKWYTEKYTPEIPQLLKEYSSIQLNKRGPILKDDGNVELREGQWVLTLKLKQQILLNNIFGVDIDPQAVEVSQLSLFLKMLEEETLNSTRQGMMFSKVLPDLSKNIVCGNSIISYDDVSKVDIQFTESDLRMLSPMDWEVRFPGVAQANGFDAIVGNPPWGAELVACSLPIVRSKYYTARTRSFDSYAIFLEQGIRLLKVDGLIGYITPDTFLRKGDFRDLRELVLVNNSLIELIETGPLFSQVRDTWCAVCFIQKMKPGNLSKVRHRKISRFIVSVEERLEKFSLYNWDQDTEADQAIWMRKEDFVIGYKASNEFQKIIERVEAANKLMNLEDTFRISRGEEGSKFNVVESESGDFYMVIPENIKKFIVSHGVKVCRDGLTSNKIDNIYTHPKIWITRIQKMRWKQRIVCGVDLRRNSCGMKTLQSIVSVKDNIDDLFYLQGILSSKLLNFWCENYLADDINQSYLGRVPVVFSNSNFAKVVDLVSQIIEAKKHTNITKIEKDLYFLDNKIQSLENKLNSIVYEIYSLNTEEIEIVEKEYYTGLK